MSSRFLARVKFYSAKKTAEESVAEWTARLQTLAEPCGFLQERDTVLRDIFAIGLGPGPLRDRLHHEIDADSSVSLAALQQLALEEEAAAQLDSEGDIESAQCVVTFGNINVKCAQESNKDQENSNAKSETTVIGARVVIYQESKCPEKQNQNNEHEPILPFNLRKQLSIFCGREQEIINLHEYLETPGCHVIVVHGIFGSGKSELVNKYAWEYRHHYNNNIIWIKYKNPEKFLSMFVVLAKQLDHKYDSENPVPLVNSIYSHFDKKGKSLFVYDDVLSRNLINDYLPNDSCKNINVLITSPYAKWGDIETMNLSPLSENESISVFKAIAKNKISLQEQEDVVQLMPKTLQGMPELVQRFAIYITSECNRNDTNFSLSEYIDELDINTLCDKPFPNWSERDNEKTIYTSLAEILENIQYFTENKDVSKMALKIINFCAFCEAFCKIDTITNSLLQLFSQYSSSIYTKSNYKLRVLFEALTILHEFSLLVYDNGNVQMNKLVQNLVLVQQKQCGTILADVCDFSIHEATKNGHLEVIKLLVCYDKSLVYHAENDKYKCIPFHIAAKTGHVHILKYFLYDHQVFMNIKNENGDSALYLAALNDRLDAVTFLINEGASIDIRNNDGSTLLHKSPSKAIVKLLIEKGISVNISDNDDVTPLHEAAADGITEVVRYLIDKGANVNALTNLNNNPLHTSAWNGQTEITKILIDKGCSLQTENSGKNTPLMMAILQRHLSVVQVFCENGCRPDDASKNGSTPMFLAHSKGYTEIYDYFLDKFPDLFEPSNNSSANVEN